MEMIISPSRRDWLEHAEDLTPPRPLANCFAGEGDVPSSPVNLLLDALSVLTMA